MTRPPSSDDFAHPLFKPHGRISHSVIDGILVTDAEGPFNKEAMEAFSKSRRAALLYFGSECRSASSIVRFRESMLMSLEALDSLSAEIRSHVIESNSTSPLLAWVADPDIEGYSFMTYRFERIFFDQGIQCRIFSEIPQAILWVKAMLASSGG